MSDPNHKQDDLLTEARDEVVAMAKQGMQHPSTRPVLIGGAVGAVAAGLLPVVSWPVGLIAGAGIMLYKRLRP